MLRLATLIVVPRLCLTALTACRRGRRDRRPCRLLAPDETTSSAPSQSRRPDAVDQGLARASAQPKVIGTVAKGLEVPWGIAFLPDGSALVTERDSGRVLQVRRRLGAPGRRGRGGPAQRRGRPARRRRVADVRARQAGLLLRHRRTTTTGCCAPPSTTAGSARSTPILTGIPKAGNHDGGRMIFGPDGMLYVSTGEAGQPDLAQDRGSLGGKILRITQDGKPGARQPVAGARRSGPGATATSRDWPSTTTAACGPRSSARTPATSST